MGPEFALMETILARDAATYLHSQRTAAYARMLCAKLGLGAVRTEQIRIAALLHDIGKVGIPDAILHKPGPLTSEEWELVRSHSAIGASIIESAGLGQIARWVYHLHERFDGDGYPDGLSAEEAPFESRLLHAADTLDAMTAERPYSPALSFEEATLAIEQNAGSQLDPAVALPLVGLMRGRRKRFARMRVVQAPPDTVSWRGTRTRRLRKAPTMRTRVGAIDIA
jgi:polar amino acid transport system substrate-binding protein